MREAGNPADRHKRREDFPLPRASEARKKSHTNHMIYVVDIHYSNENARRRSTGK